ncbi:MAG: mechanosensitive ion channel [Clostridia bacterium]|nr:mechanosensitive ion channel [Clostridia bacterium]
MSAIWDLLKQFPVKEAIKTVCLIAACLIVIKFILFFFDKALRKTKLGALACKVLRNIVKAFLLVISVIIVLSSWGISVTSLIAMLSVVGVAFSLAIQDFLGNVFGGIQIISNHPFKVGDYVEAGGEAGTVCEVGLFYTKLNTPDKKLVQIPNSKIANESIINYSEAENRRIEFLVSVSYDTDVEKVKSVLLGLLTEHPLVLAEEGMMPVAHVKEFKDNDICYVARAWSKNSDYWTVYFDIMDAIKPTFDKNDIQFSYPHMNVHMIAK